MAWVWVELKSFDTVIRNHNTEFSDLGEIISRYKNLDISNRHLEKHHETL